MKERKNTFVTPDGESTFPTPPRLERMPDIETQDIDAGKLFGRTPVHTHERRDPLTEAQAFMLKYAGLTVILLILAVGLTLRLEWHYTVGIVVFALLATGAYWLLSFTESLFTGPGVERHRLSVGGNVLTRQVEADERVRLAQVRLQREQLTAQREHNTHVVESYRQRAALQLKEHSQPQAHSNRLVSFDISSLERPTFAQSADEPSYRDEAREVLLDFLQTLYTQPDAIDDAGFIARDTVIPWGKRGGLASAKRELVRGLLADMGRGGGWLLRFDAERRLWQLNVALYADYDAALDALDAMPTRSQGSGR